MAVSSERGGREVGRTGRAGSANGAGDATTDPVVYRETLRTPWWWFVVALGVAGLLSVEMEISTLHLTDWIVLCVLGPLFLALTWSLGRWRVEIVDTASGPELRVRGAHIAVADLSGAVALDANTMRRVVGREGDPAAFVTNRPWIGSGVQVWIDDPDDPTPYWVLSTRHPKRLADALNALI